MKVKLGSNLKIEITFDDLERKTLIEYRKKHGRTIEEAIEEKLEELFYKSHWLCVSCGARVHTNDDFCSNCGKPD